MKYGSLSSTVLLIITTALLSACGSTTGGSPANVYSGSVFISDREASGVNELFLVDNTATEVTKISAPLDSGGSVKSFKVSPNIGFIAYLADQDIAGVDELYFIKQSTGVQTKVNQTLSAGNVTSYEWSPNGLYMAYLADVDNVGDFELYVSDANTVKKVSSASFVGDVIDFKWSPDSQHIAFKTLLTSTSKPELFVSKSDASVIATQVSDSTIGAGPTEYKWAPSSLTVDGRLLAYMSDQDNAGTIDLYTTTIASLTSTKVTDATTGSVMAFRWPNLNYTRLAFSAELLTSGDVNLFSTQALNNTNVFQLSAVTTSGGVSGGFRWSPNNVWLAYVADQVTPGVFELFVTKPSVTGTGAKVSTTMVAGGDVDVTDGFIWGLSSVRLIYRADQITDNVYELFSSTTDGASATSGVKISGNLVAGGSVDDNFQLSPFGTIVSYVADQQVDGAFELYATTLTTNTSVVKLSADMNATRRVFQHDWSSDGSKIFYTADQDVDGINDGYTIKISDSVNLNLTSDTVNNTSITQGVFIDSFGSTDLLKPL